MRRNQPKSGFVYYTLNDDNTGAVKVITFSELPDFEIRGLEVASINAEELIEVINEKTSLSNLRVVFDSENSPRLERTMAVSEEDLVDIFTHVSRYDEDDTNIVLLLNRHGRLKTCVSSNKSMPYPGSSRIRLYVTDVGQPNKLQRSYDFSLKQVYDSGVVLFDLPYGRPMKSYSLWAVLPGPRISMKWSIEDDGNTS